MTSDFNEKVVECWIPAQAQRLRLLRCFIKDTAFYLGIDPELVQDLVLAVNEACMNIIQHAYHHQPNKEIHVTILHGEGRIAFVLQDDAPCVDPVSIIPRSLDEIRPGGLGMHFIREIMDEVIFEECINHGNTLILAKYISNL